MDPYRPQLAMLALAGACLISDAAFAGLQTANNVIISSSPHVLVASGDLGFVYNSSDNTQFIGCYSYSPGATGGCYAQDTAGTYRSCYTTDPTLLAGIRSLQTDAYVEFYWNTSGQCIEVDVFSDSGSAPKR